MIYRRKLPIAFILFLPLLFLILSSCEKFSGDQTIPAYLSVDSIYLQTDIATEGSASHNITDAWVYVDDNLVGTFQMPARFPVLYTGSHKLTIIPGIKRNGIATTRVTYPFYDEITRTISFTPDSTISVGVLKTAYFSNTKFTWKEDFEGVAISLDTSHQSKAELEVTKTDSLTFEGLHSGMIQLDSASNFFEVVTHNYYPIPKAPVYLEMNFNSNSSFQAGVYIFTSDYIIYQAPILNLNPTGYAWKKIYIDLTTTLNSYLNSTTFKIYLGGYKDSGLENARILFDNLKIVTR